MLARLSARGRAAVARLERAWPWPFTAAEALRGWEQFLHDPAHRIWNCEYGCGEPLCCPDPEELRQALHTIPAHLPPKDAKAFRRHLAHLNDLW